MCIHELILIDTLAEQIPLPVNWENALRELYYLIRCQVENKEHIASVELEAVQGVKGADSSSNRKSYRSG